MVLKTTGPTPLRGCLAVTGLAGLGGSSNLDSLTGAFPSGGESAGGGACGLSLLGSIGPAVGAGRSVCGGGAATTSIAGAAAGLAVASFVGGGDAGLGSILAS